MIGWKLVKARRFCQEQTRRGILRASFYDKIGEETFAARRFGMSENAQNNRVESILVMGDAIQ
jgi:hypothetical protein